MGVVIFWGILVILITLVIGASANMLIDSSDTSMMGGFFLVMGTLLFVLGVVCFTHANQEYFEKKEYSATEYQLNRKIITVNENDTVKVDTVFSLTRKNK